MVFIVYFWYVYAKPILMLALSIIFGILSLTLLYAQLANLFGIDFNILYNLITAPENSSFYQSNVNLP